MEFGAPLNSHFSRSDIRTDGELERANHYQYFKGQETTQFATPVDEINILPLVAFINIYIYIYILCRTEEKTDLKNTRTRPAQDTSAETQKAHKTRTRLFAGKSLVQGLVGTRPADSFVKSCGHKASAQDSEEALRSSAAAEPSRQLWILARPRSHRAQG